jgi:hypothetical protein
MSGVNYMNLSQIRRQRARLSVSRNEYEGICNLLGRAKLKTTIDDRCIEFYNGGEKPVARMSRHSTRAEVMKCACCDDTQAASIESGLKTAGYVVTRC